MGTQEDRKEAKDIEDGEGVEAENQKPNKGKKFFVWVSAFVLMLLIVAYSSVAVFYSKKFFPGTVINGSDCGNMGRVAVDVRLMLELQDYQAEVRGRDPRTGEQCLLATISAQDVDLKAYSRAAELDGILEQQKEWLWPSFLWSAGYTYTLTGNINMDEEKLMAILESQPAFLPENMTAPEDAYIKGYSEAEQAFVIEPEYEGARLDMEKVKAAIYDAVESQTGIVDLEEAGCYVEPAVRAGDDRLQECIAQANRYLETKITYDWNDNEVILDAEQIKDWVSIEGERAVLDEDAVKAFVKSNANKYDTYGKSRGFRTALGYDLTLPRKSYGWMTDRDEEAKALTELIKAGTVGSREPIYAVEARRRGTDDIGDDYVEADMTHQHLYLYEDGELKLETDFVSGNMSLGGGYITPEGIFGLTYKTTNAVLRGRDYETPVNYWMPFYGNYGMHDATWRGAFGGTIYLTNGSHGCLNLPLDKAAEIYQYVSEGFPVICYYYPPGMLPEEQIQEEVIIEDTDEE